jgi:hypothetical protein
VFFPVQSGAKVRLFMQEAVKVAIARQDGETVLEDEPWCYTFKPEVANE